MEQMEYTQAQLESVKELSEAVKSGSDQEALFMKKQDVKRLTSNYNKLKTEPLELDNMEFVKEKYQYMVTRFMVMILSILSYHIIHGAYS